MNNKTRAALAAAFAVVVCGTSSQGFSQEAGAVLAATAGTAVAAPVAPPDDQRIPVGIPAGPAAPAAHVPVPAGPGGQQAFVMPYPGGARVAYEQLNPQVLPAVYAPGPGYGHFTKARKEMVCYTPKPETRRGLLDGGLSMPAAGVAVGALTSIFFYSVFF